MNYPPPRTPGSAPYYEWDYYSGTAFAMPPLPPQPIWFDPSTLRRPATRAAHTRANSFSLHGGLAPRTHLESPRYNSVGDYCTVDVSAKHFPSSRRTSAPYPTYAKRDRRPSYTNVWASTPFGESDEDETIEALGRTYVLPAQSHFRSRHVAHASMDEGGRYTNQAAHPQSSPYNAAAAYARASPYYAAAAYARVPPHDLPPRQPFPPQTRPPTSHGHARRASASVPQRPSTVRPAAPTHRPKPAPTRARATEADAAKHAIPAGYKLKHWDPTEEPILLLGSVFDADSLGKWIFDWTIFAHRAHSPIADMAGDLWLILIKWAGNMKRAEGVVGIVRNPISKETIQDFITGGGRLRRRLRRLLRACELPMLKAADDEGTELELGETSGVEFVETLFGRERMLDKTLEFMQNMRIFNLRFDANCDEIVRNPYA
ncbi:hypothetical protein E4U43_004153 [Claviceps pusilla]|uniref:Vegetative cell wall protein gp1 n=1 Tax=Claviceps pusilla TaxID=123648 RepID=A0A9P7N5W8_9HYPO|nr:hypothetical protein E4U43_004153 [Claviceps pusilla]